MFRVIFLFCLLGVSSTLSASVVFNGATNERVSAIEQLVLNRLEELRELMLTGSDFTPVLDPFEADKVHLNLDDLGLFNSYITLKNLTVNNLSKFEMNSLSIRLTSILQRLYTAEFSISIPTIDVDVKNYNLSVQNRLNIFGNGELSLKAIQPRLSGTVIVRVRISIIGGAISLTVQSMNLKFELESFKTRITGLLGNSLVSEFVSIFLGYFVTDFVNEFEEEISLSMNTYLPDIINGILSTNKLNIPIPKDIQEEIMRTFGDSTH